jgi:CubicO group peptidase (beta-lactamase class C family)
VTAVLALQLAEEGVLDLHAPVTDYVDWMTMPGPLRAHRVPRGWSRLGEVTGRSYAELVQGRVLDRLGMRASVPNMVHETHRRMPGGHVPY